MPPPPDKFVLIDCYFQYESEKAWLIRQNSTEEVWVPKSILRNLEVAPNSKYGTMEIPEWFARKKGFDYEYEEE